MELDDEEFEKLLGEIPHATSGPSQLEGADQASDSAREEMPSQPAAKELSKQMAPMRSSQLFGDAYQAFQVAEELQPRGEKQLSPFYSGTVLDNPNEEISNGPVDMHQRKVQSRHQPLPQQDKPVAMTLASGENQMVSVSHQPPDHSLTSAFSNLNFDGKTSSKHAIHLSHENGNGRTGNGCVASGEVPGPPTALFNQLGVTVGVPTSLNPGGVPCTASVSRSCSYPMDLYPENSSISSQLGSNLPYSTPPQLCNGHSFQKILRRDLSGANDSSSAGSLDAHANGRRLDGYANGAGLSANVIGGSFDGYANGGGLNAYANIEGLNGNGNVHSNGLEEYASGTGFDVYYNGGGLDLETKVGVHLYSNHIAKQLQPVAAFPAAVQGLHALPHQAVSRSGVVSPSLGLQHELSPDSRVASYLQAQQVHRMQLAWQRKEEERRRMQQILVQNSQALACLQNCAGSSPQMGRQNFSHPSFFSGNEQLFKSLQSGPAMAATDWSLQLCQGSAGIMNHPEFVPQFENHCRFFAQGFCGRGETCPFIHSESRGTMGTRASQPGSAPSSKDARVAAVSAHEEKCGSSAPVKILSRRSSRTVAASVTASVGVKKDSSANGHTNGQASANGHHSARSNSVRSEQHHFRGAIMEQLETDLSSPADGLQPQLKYSSLAEVEGRIYFIAKDQHGCRFLQRKFDEGGPEDVQKIFLEIIDHIIELMTDPFGNYLIQKLLEVCNDDQRMEILHAVTTKGELINVSLNMHGTRAVQKLIETLKSRQQVSMVISSLRSGVVALIKDLNGNHVVQRCLQRLSSDDSRFIFEAAASHCVEIATHRHGCCVLQRCVDFSTGVQRQRLVAEIASNALVLSQDPFGNYVVQYILDLGIPWASVEVMERLAENYACLSTQKFSSNVVEKCLKLAGEEHMTRLIHELMNSSRLAQLLQDPYANYVIQSALTVSKGALHTGLVEAIRPHMPALRSSPYGKRILSRTNFKK